MELKAYLRVLMRQWHIVLLTFLITYGATLAFTFTQAPVYAATATFVVKLNPSFNDRNMASSIDVLSRRTEIATTYSTLATSRLIKKQAADELGLSEDQRSNLNVASELVAGTNILDVSVEGNNPVLVRDFTNAVGSKLVSYVDTLYETYTLQPLDKAVLPDTPAKPNKPLNLILGAIMGLVLGAGLAFLSAYLQAPLETVTNVGVLDEETGVFNKRYFTSRLRQELSRATRNNYPLSVALLNVDDQGTLSGASPTVRREALRRAAMLLSSSLREEDVMARFDDTIFALLLPDLTNDAAQDTIERLQLRIAATPLELEQSGVSLNMHGTAGVVVSQGESIEPEDLLIKAEQALADAETSANGKIRLLPSDGNHSSPMKRRFGRKQRVLR